MLVVCLMLPVQLQANIIRLGSRFFLQCVCALHRVSTSSGLWTWVGLLTPAFAEQSAHMSTSAVCMAACFAQHGHRCNGLHNTS